MCPSDVSHRDSTFTVPNVLTALRIVMAVVAAACFAAAYAEREAVVLCIIATVLDAFDGWYARTFSQCSNLGKHLDPLADKLLMAVVFGLIAIKMNSGFVWVLVGLIGFREVFMTVFRAYSLRRHKKFIPASALGKAKMIVQSTVGVAIITYVYFWNGGFDISQVYVVPPLGLILILSYVSAVAYLRSWRGSTGTRTAGVALGVEVALAEGEGESRRMVVGK